MTQDFDLCIVTQDPRGRPVDEVLCIVGVGSRICLAFADLKFVPGARIVP